MQRGKKKAMVKDSRILQDSDVKTKEKMGRSTNVEERISVLL